MFRMNREDVGRGLPVGSAGAARTDRAGRRLRLLLIAPGCDGEDVGEAWVAYQWVHRLAARHDVTLLTYYKRGKTRPSQQVPAARVIEWPDPPVFGRAERLNSMLKPGWLPFYFRARRWIRRARARGERFDVVHQLLPVAMRYPCPATGLGTPVIIGPVGGSLETPPGFAIDGDTAPWFVNLRSLDRLRMRWDPWLRRTYDNAQCVIGIAPYVKEFLANRRIRRFEVMSETGLQSLPELGARRQADGTVRLLYVGRIVRTKGLRDAIRALSLVTSRQRTVLDVVGDGFDRGACEALAAQLGVAHRVHFHGRQPRAVVDDFYRSADVFLFPSYREPGGNVIFESMAFSLPLIVSDLGGPGNVVDDRCGIRVHPEDPAQYARDLAKAITRLAESPERRAALGAEARARVSAVALWDRKIVQLEGLYHDIGAARPDRVASRS
jgi:glycosyltransferase involved in cell wall biosynthesis